MQTGIDPREALKRQKRELRNERKHARAAAQYAKEQYESALMRIPDRAKTARITDGLQRGTWVEAYVLVPDSELSERAVS